MNNEKATVSLRLPSTFGAHSGGKSQLSLHADTIEKLLEELRPPRDLSRNPLFQVMCVLHNTPQQALELPGLTVSLLELDPGTARFDVTLRQALKSLLNLPAEEKSN